MTYRTLPLHDLTVQFHLKFILIIQHEVPFINTSEATKKVEGPNRERQVYKCHEPLKSCRLVNPILHVVLQLHNNSVSLVLVRN